MEDYTRNKRLKLFILLSLLFVLATSACNSKIPATKIHQETLLNFLNIFYNVNIDSAMHSFLEEKNLNTLSFENYLKLNEPFTKTKKMLKCWESYTYEIIGLKYDSIQSFSRVDILIQTAFSKDTIKNIKIVKTQNQSSKTTAYKIILDWNQLISMLKHEYNLKFYIATNLDRNPTAILWFESLLNVQDPRYYYEYGNWLNEIEETEKACKYYLKSYKLGVNTYNSEFFEKISICKNSTLKKEFEKIVNLEAYQENPFGMYAKGYEHYLKFNADNNSLKDRDSLFFYFKYSAKLGNTKAMLQLANIYSIQKRYNKAMNIGCSTKILWKNLKERMRII